MKRCRCAHACGENMRRSLTVTAENDKKILLVKGRFLTGESPFDIDYTTMVNILIELGHKLMTTAWKESANPTVVINKSEIIESFKKHFFNAELKEEAVGDLVAEIIFKKFVEQTNLVASKQIPQQNILALPAEQTTITDTKREKYIS
jgi:hypothetical protein